MGAIGYFTSLAFGFVIISGKEAVTHGLLYPRESETREVKMLDGMWNFVKSNDTNPTEGVRDKWYLQELSKSRPTISMPVPASYNDITEDASLRDHVGTVWYDRKFFVPNSWFDKRVWVRFGSVHYEAIVWINSEIVVKHSIGHLPFEADITDYVQYGQENLITVLCDNALIQTTIPQGRIVELPKDNGTAIVQTYSFDFFNYAGIHRSVVLYTTPKMYIEDVIVTTDLVNDTIGRVFFKISHNASEESIVAFIQIRDKEGFVVASKTAEVDEVDDFIDIIDAKLWWPYLMHPDPGYLYTLEIFLQTPANEIIDVYRLKIGVRTLSWNNKQFLINGKPIYFRGFGKHEDSDIRGKGLDLALLTKDFNLLKWVGANAYRTSHYPYSEESMQFADENGIMIIDECPSVDTENYTPALLDMHKSSIEQLIHRDKNHASVVMWSIANEPRTQQLNADTYFGAVANHTRTLDPNRPITAALNAPYNVEKAAQFLDIISFNRYNGWYQNAGQLDMIASKVVDEATAWHNKHDKLVLMTEYGADTIAGLHILPPVVWSEEYQEALFSKHFKAFDILRQRGFFIGEFIWNFADFQTAQTVTRVGGNKKGIFKRQRQPKAVAYLVRKRYYDLALHLDDSSGPEDLYLYTSVFSNVQNKIEL